MSNQRLSEVTPHCSNQAVVSHLYYGQHGAEEFLAIVQEFVMECQRCTGTQALIGTTATNRQEA